jgi:hypothetical protein
MFLRTHVAGSAYVLTGFPLALIAFVLLVTGASLALGTLVIVVGFAVAALTLSIARGFAALERTRAQAVLGRPISTPAYRPLRPGALGAALSAGAIRAAGSTWSTASSPSLSPPPRSPSWWPGGRARSAGSATSPGSGRSRAARATRAWPS